tara:strand:+ start:233 stop:5500 length:5268 start_codon:yes stop_codon:yes gene_type:complete
MISSNTTCPADINNDGIVDVIDLLQVVNNWGSIMDIPADINSDGIVDVIDLLYVVNSWGPCADHEWVEDKITSSDGLSLDLFGHSVVVGDGVAVIGAPHAGNPEQGTLVHGVGAIYIYRYESGLGWIESQKILGEQVSPVDLQQLGSSVDLFQADNTSILNEDRIIAGAIDDSECGSDSGAAYIFKKNGSNWSKEQKLIAWDCGNWPHLFSNSVALSDSYAFVGARGDDDKGYASGAVYVFKWNGNSWIQHQKLVANDGTEFDWFGSSISVSNDFLIVGAMYDDRHPSGSESSKGGVYVFKIDKGGYWQHQYPQLEVVGGDGDEFGSSVAIQGNVIAIGARRVQNSNGSQGAVYIFENQIGESWFQTHKLTPSDGGAGDGFGNSVSMYGDSILIGSYRSNGNSTGSGSVYLFNKIEDSQWVQSKKFASSDGNSSDEFGNSVSIYGDVILIGSHYNNALGDYSGASYVYKKNESSFNGDYRFDSGTRFVLSDNKVSGGKSTAMVTYGSEGFAYGSTNNDSINLTINTNDYLRVINTSRDLLPISVGVNSQSGSTQTLFMDYFNNSIRINGRHTSTLILRNISSYKIRIPSKYSTITISSDNKFNDDLTNYYSTYKSSSIDESHVIDIKSGIISENILYLKLHSFNKFIKIRILKEEFKNDADNFQSDYVNLMDLYDFTISPSSLWRFSSKSAIPILTDYKSDISRQKNKGSDVAYSIYGVSQPDLYLINERDYNIVSLSSIYPVQFTSDISGGSIKEYNFTRSIKKETSNLVRINSDDAVFASSLNGTNHILAPRFVNLIQGKGIKIKLKIFFDNSSSILLKWDSEHALYYGKQTSVAKGGAIRIPNNYDAGIGSKDKYKNAHIKEVVISLNDTDIGEDFDIRLMSNDAIILNSRIRVFAGNKPSNTMGVEVKKSNNMFQFTINNQVKPELKLIRDYTYRFDQSHSSNSHLGHHHPLYFTLSRLNISDGGTPMVKGVVVSGSLGKSRIVRLTISDSNNFSNMYYSCETHGLDMGNRLHILDPIEKGKDPYWTDSLRKIFNIPKAVIGEGEMITLTPMEDDGSYIYYQNIYDKYMGGKIHFTSSESGYDISKLKSQEGISSSDNVNLKFNKPGRYVVCNNDFYAASHYFVITVTDPEEVKEFAFNDLIYNQNFDYNYPFDLSFNSKEVERLSNDISLGVSSSTFNYEFVNNVVESLGSSFFYCDLSRASYIQQMSHYGLGSTLTAINKAKRYSLSHDRSIQNISFNNEIILNWDLWNTSSSYMDQERLGGNYSNETMNYINYINRVRGFSIDIDSDADFSILKKSYSSDSARALLKSKTDIKKSNELGTLSFNGIVNIEIGNEIDKIDVINNIINNKTTLDMSDYIIININDFNYNLITDASFIDFINNIDDTINLIEQNIGRKIDIVHFDLNNIIKSGKYSPTDISSLIIRLKSHGIDRYIFNLNSTDVDFYGVFYRFINDVRIRVLQTYLSAKNKGKDGLVLKVDGEFIFVESKDSREIRVIEFYSNSSPRGNKLSNWWLAENSVNILTNKMNALIKSGVERIFLKYPLGISDQNNVIFDQVSDIEEIKRIDFLNSISEVSSTRQSIEIGLFVGVSELFQYYSVQDGWDIESLRDYMSEVCRTYYDNGVRSVAIKINMGNESNIKFMEEAFELFRSIIIEHSIRVCFYGFYLNRSKMFGNLLLKYPSIIDNYAIKRYYTKLQVDLKNVEWHILGATSPPPKTSNIVSTSQAISSPVSSASPPSATAPKSPPPSSY